MDMNPTFPSWDNKSKVLAVLVVLLVLVVGFQAYRLSGHPGPASSRLPVTAADAAPAPAASAIPAFPDFWGAPGSPGDLWSQMDQFQQQINRLFSDMNSRMQRDEGALLVPRLDLREEKDRYVVRLDMPGAEKASIKVNVEGQTLTVSGARELGSSTAAATNGKLLRQERSLAQFERTIQVPAPVKADAVTAQYDNGVLTVILPKSPASAPSAAIPVR